MKSKVGLYKFWMFDLDGTLIDSLDSTFEALEWATAKQAGRAMTRAEFGAHLGLPEERILANTGFADPQGEVLAAYVEHLSTLVSSRVPVFAGMRELLGLVADRSIKLGLFTARGQAATKMLLDRLDLRSAFADRIVTGSELTQGKPHPEGLLKLMARLGADPRESFYLGDSPMDMKMARSAKVKAFGAGWALHANHNELEKAGAEMIFYSVEEFRASIRV